MKTVRRIKSVVKELLEKYDKGRLVELAIENPRVVSALISMTYDKRDVITWRAIETVGLITGRIAARSPEQAGEIVRRLLWSVTEESGGIGWTAIEMLAEVVVNAHERFRHIVPLILEFYDEEVFKDSVLYAIYRIADANPDLFDDLDKIAEILNEGLRSNNPQIRGLSALAFNVLQGKLEGVDQNIFDYLKDDEETFKIYINGTLIDKRIKDILNN